MTTDTINIDNANMETIAQYGKEIGALLEHADMPESAKLALFEVIQELPLEHIEPVYQALRTGLEADLVVELSPEYQEEAEQIDQATLEKIESIVNPA